MDERVEAELEGALVDSLLLLGEQVRLARCG